MSVHLKTHFKTLSKPNFITPKSKKASKAKVPQKVGQALLTIRRGEPKFSCAVLRFSAYMLPVVFLICQEVDCTS